MLLIFMNVSFGQEKFAFINSQVVELRSKKKKKTRRCHSIHWGLKRRYVIDNADNVPVNMVVKNIPFKESYHASYITVFMR